MMFINRYCKEHYGNRYYLNIVYLLLLLMMVMATEKVLGQVSVSISSQFSAIYYSNSIRIGPGDHQFINLSWNEFEDRYNIYISTGSENISIIVIDGQDRKIKNINPKLLLSETVIGDKLLKVPSPPSSEGLIFVLQNKNKIVANIDITIYRVGTRPTKITDEIKKHVTIPLKMLDHFYRLPDFSVTVAPCGLIKPAAKPDIIICTELIAELSERRMSTAIYSILLHEIAHTLLDLWGLPGKNNEDLADEFMGVFLARAIPEAIDNYIRWYELDNTITKSVIKLTIADPHKLTYQRKQNIRELINSPKEIQQRWGRLLLPFTK